ncbi:hypothetical protein [Bacillus toyonensis]|uniref:hypothetical protein n=1 Tax=Bacillus toyonensis TaxID=155322 RepID=UPI002E1A0C47|nr:hypothetical protein [Bacillus toyonensis]
MCALQVSPLVSLDVNKVYAATEEQKSPEENFGLARYYFAENSFYNAVHYASLAFKGGLQTLEVKTLLNNAAGQLSAIADQQAKDKKYNDAVINYQKLIDSDGVPANIKDAAQKNSDIILKEFNDGTTALKAKNYKEAVRLTSLSFAKGIYINKVVAQLKEASTQLSILSDIQANNKQYNEAVEGYAILKKYYGVPADIQQAAEKNYDSIFKEYYAGNEAFLKGEYYNAVEYLSQSFNKGLTVKDVKDLMGRAADLLYKTAELGENNGNKEGAIYQYTKLVKSNGVPEEIKQAAQNKLNNLQK